MSFRTPNVSGAVYENHTLTTKWSEARPKHYSRKLQFLKSQSNLIFGGH